MAEPDNPLLSVKEVELDQTPFSGLLTTRQSAETPDPGDRDRYSRRKPCIKDPKRLNDRVEPTWTSWVIAINNKLEQDIFQFDTEKAKIAYIFSYTEGQASSLLTPWIRRGCAQPFRSANKVF